MAMRLQYSTRTIERDINFVRRGGVTYYADGATTAAAAIAMWDADADGTLKTHPDDPTIPFDSISVTPLQNGAGYNVTARFSTDGSGRLEQGPPVNEEGWHAWDRGKRRGEAEIAMNERAWIVPDFGNTEPYEVWRLRKMAVLEIYPRRTLKFRVTTDTQDIFDVLDDAIGDVHLMPNNQYWQFTDSETRPIDASTWEVSLTWERDKGTPYPDPMAGDGFAIAGYDVTGIPIPYDTETIYRPPYCKIGGVLAAQDPRTTQNRVFMAFTGKLNPDGWHQFPGSELI